MYLPLPPKISTNPLITQQGVAKNPSIASTSREWQIPVGLQLVSGGILLIGTFTLPESIRWLLTNNRTDDAWKSITWIRGDDGPKTRDEFTETQLGLQAERAEREGFSLRELLEPANRLRFLVGPVLFIFQNATGSSALAVFAPEYFKLVAGSSSNRNLLLTGLFGAVKVISSTVFIWLLAERFSRRITLVSGAALMAACMLITALIVDNTPTQTSSGSVTNAGRATVAMIYLDIIVSISSLRQNTIYLLTPPIDLQLLMGPSSMGVRARDFPHANPRARTGHQHAGTLGVVVLLLIRKPVYDQERGRQHLPHLHGI